MEICILLVVIRMISCCIVHKVQVGSGIKENTTDFKILFPIEGSAEINYFVRSLGELSTALKKRGVSSPSLRFMRSPGENPCSIVVVLVEAISLLYKRVWETRINEPSVCVISEESKTHGLRYLSL